MESTPNPACTRPLEEHQDYSGGSRRIFWHFSWLQVGSGKMAFSRPAHQRVTPAVRRFEASAKQQEIIYIKNMEE